jgi:aquaporin Z
VPAALREHWPEYAIEAAALGCFMLAACTLGTLLEHPASPVREAIADPLPRRMLMGVAMGLTAIAIIHSPWGKRSGAHINPSWTLTTLRLGRVAPWDAAFYVLAQFVGGMSGVQLASALLGARLANPAVHYVATVPGPGGVAVAFAAEVAITGVLASVVLRSAASPRVQRYTGLLVGLLVATYITVEAPLSGMSMNPARSFGSALAARDWAALWIYFVAPPVGMLGAAQLFLWRRGLGDPLRDRAVAARALPCMKWRPHRPGEPCLFCAYAAERAADESGYVQMNTDSATAAATTTMPQMNAAR